ncbi:putative Late nodulin [Medicago truncatula]|uniref:Nodule Cysteine-Rich (NCR) secreted peptide n=1 Tax=Medicago truncatula TaxID=3880 RepID=G7L160_MEDTR|nr:Nodule Cysteine-Rich (NCR) secreted peptide [Medicago truncatula]RHN44890.1 putative Late nodulin [Medicago truncatula]
MARILYFFYTLLIFVSLFMIAINGSLPDAPPCLFTPECPPDMCPTDLTLKCINLTCQCTSEYDID